MSEPRQKTLFKKYLRITLSIVLASFLLLGMVMLVFVSQYWESEKQTLLRKNAEYMSRMAQSAAVYNEEEKRYELSNNMEMILYGFSEHIDADIFITDQYGERILGTYTNSNTETDRKVDPSIVRQVMLGGGYEAQGTLSGVYRETYYIVGEPVVVDNVPIGAVFVASSIQSLSSYRMEVLRMFLLAAIAAFMVTFCVVWVFSYQLVKPLRQMSAAARSFGEGDFSIRVPVTSSDEIGELATAFNNMAASLASGENMRRNFIANVSHELKTPMTTIAGFIDGILDGTIPPEREAYYLRTVSQEVKRLSRLVRTMLDLSRIDSGELRLRPARFDLTNTILVAMLSFEKPIEEKHLEIRGLENAESLFVDGDPDMIHQVVYNLFENAVKFTNPGGYIEVRVEQGSDRTTVSVRNSGHGIEPDEIRMIFDRFYKTDKSRSQDKNGMGLGLYIVKTIIHLHGGEISVSSIVDQYTQFTFWIPRQPEGPPLKDGALPGQRAERESAPKPPKSSKKNRKSTSRKKSARSSAPKNEAEIPESEPSSPERNDTE